MSTARQILSSATLFVLAGALCSAQNIAPSHSGTVNYFEGDVTVDGVKLVSQVARFSEVKEQSVLHTGLGRAEIILTPGVLLRVAENSSVRMLDNRLMSTRVEFLSGTAMVESDDPGTGVKDPAVTIVYKDFEAQPLRFGVFEISSEPGRVRVFKGEARVIGNGTSLSVKDGNLVNLSITMATAKFDSKTGDDLYLWSRDRSAYLSAASMSSAKTLGSGFGTVNSAWNASTWSGFSGGWYYNRLLGMYTFMPFAGTFYGPFGYGTYNPVTIYDVYDPAYYWGGAGGARTSTTAGVPLTHITAVGATNGTRGQQLPRLSYAANLHPTLTSPARGTEPAVSGNAPPLAARNNGMFGASASQAYSSSSVPTGLTSSSVAQSVSAPAMAAPAVSAGGSRAPAVSVRR